MNIENKIAEYLLQSKAIKLNATKPFLWASGWKSPIYCDNRITLSYPEIRQFIRDQFIEIILEKYNGCNLIAGVATGAIAQGALVAEKMNLPFVYVRPEAKKHGRENLIEGEIKKGQKVVVIEDLISTGGSSLKAVASLRASGVEVMGMLAIFSYGFDVAINNFKESNCKLDTLGNYDALLQTALEMNYIEEKYLEMLKNMAGKSVYMGDINMAKIESRIGTVMHSDKMIFGFLSDFNNFEQLIPADKVKNWTSDGESCSFTVDGIGNVGLRIIEKEEFKLLKISSEGKSPISFLMWIQMKQIDEKDTKVKITVDPQVNAMLMGMVKKPLKDFSDVLIDRLEKLSFGE